MLQQLGGQQICVCVPNWRCAGEEQRLWRPTRIGELQVWWPMRASCHSSGPTHGRIVGFGNLTRTRQGWLRRPAAPTLVKWGQLQQTLSVRIRLPALHVVGIDLLRANPAACAWIDLLPGSATLHVAGIELPPHHSCEKDQASCRRTKIILQSHLRGLAAIS